MHGICCGGVAAAVNPTVPEAQHLSLLPSTRWAQPEEHAKLPMFGPPREPEDGLRFLLDTKIFIFHVKLGECNGEVETRR